MDHNCRIEIMGGIHLIFTRVVSAENTYDLEEEMNEVISEEADDDARLKDIKFSSVFQGGVFGSEKIFYSAVLIFEENGE